jgi:replicative DNA helicase
MNNLKSDYVVELFAIALQKKTVFQIVKQYMQFSYLQREQEKKLFQYMSKYYDRTGSIPTIGQLQQQFEEDTQVLDLLGDIREIEVGDENYDYSGVVNTFEKYIKKMKFLDANDKITESYNSGKKEKAWSLFVKYAEEFAAFSIQDAKFDTVFGDFSTRQALRQNEDYNHRFKVPTGIDELDYRLGGESGGPESGEFVLWLGDSGVGKSQCLISLGISAARHGARVAHFQLEGTKEQCLNRYDAAWTGTLYQDIKVGNIPSKKMDVTRRIVKKLSRNDIIVSSEESFNAKTLVDVRRELQEMERAYGKIQVIIIDYLELLEVGDGHNYSPSEERFRQTKLAKGMKMLAMEFNAVVHAATQSNIISEEQKNDPEFVITRANLSEDRGKVRPADIFITINQTRDERREEMMRLYTDKLRDYKSNDVIKICNNFSYSRFYDRRRTLELVDEE